MHLVALDQLLRLGFRSDGIATGVGDNEFDLPSRKHVVALLEEDLDALFHLAAAGGKRAGADREETNPDWFGLRLCEVRRRARGYRTKHHRCNAEPSAQHRSSFVQELKAWISQQGTRDIRPLCRGYAEHSYLRAGRVSHARPSRSMLAVHLSNVNWKTRTSMVRRAARMISDPVVYFTGSTTFAPPNLAMPCTALAHNGISYDETYLGISSSSD